MKNIDIIISRATFNKVRKAVYSSKVSGIRLDTVKDLEGASKFFIQLENYVHPGKSVSQNLVDQNASHDQIKAFLKPLGVSYSFPPMNARDVQAVVESRSSTASWVYKEASKVSDTGTVGYVSQMLGIQ
jgi:hypothetical protein